jgi:hypothetical protein
MNYQPTSPWYLALIADPSSRPNTALADALLAALEKAFFNPRHQLHRRFFNSGSLEQREHDGARRRR